MTDNAALFAELEKPLPNGLIKSLKGNRYIEGFEVINQANKLFGFGGWGYDIVGIEYKEATRGSGKTTGLYFATVRVTVLDWPSRTDVGVGIMAGDSPEAHDTAVKGAVTEGIKRAMRTFGPQFGNDLYDKLYDPNAAQQGQQGQQQSRPPVQRQQQLPAQGAPAGQNPDAARYQAQDQTLAELVAAQGADFGRILAVITHTLGDWETLTVPKREEALRKLGAQKPDWWAKQRAGAA